MSTTSTVAWDAPGAGQWALDRSHMPAGCTPIVQHIVTMSMPRGMRRVFAELGTPLETLDARFVNGQFYSRLRPLISPDKPADEVAARVRAEDRHPPASRDAAPQRAPPAACWQPKPWTEVIHQWHNGGKAGIEARNLELQDVDLDGPRRRRVCSPTCNDCIEHCISNWEHHFWLHGYDLGPIGRYLFEAGEWGPTPDELLSLLEGASPSTSAPAQALVELQACGRSARRAPTTLERAARRCRRRSRRRSTTSCAIVAWCCSRATTSTASRWASVPIWCWPSS